MSPNSDRFQRGTWQRDLLIAAIALPIGIVFGPLGFVYQDRLPAVAFNWLTSCIAMVPLIIGAMAFLLAYVRYMEERRSNKLRNDRKDEVDDT
jgi:hypothetical protein